MQIFLFAGQRKNELFGEILHFRLVAADNFEKASV
jgi:hypothetical protein